MNITFQYPKSIFAFIPLRTLVEKLSLEKNLDPLCKHLLYPWNPNPEIKKASLTDRPDYDDQIRFFLAERSYRKVQNIAKHILSLDKKIHLTIVNFSFSDPIFLRLTEELMAYGVDISFEQKLLPKDNINLHDKEKILQNILQINAHLSVSQLNLVKEMVKKYVSIGDAWTVENIFDRICKKNPIEDFIHDLATCKCILGKTFESEFLLEMYKRKDPEKRSTKANYALSMLYLRHHPRYAKNHEKAKELLDQAYEKAPDAENSQSETFNRIFNRNGFALTLFREKKIDEAIVFLKRGIEDLDSSKSIYHMHKTVLIYNLARCYVEKNEMKNAIKWYQKLVDLDPQYPEYHMELARCYLNSGQPELALCELKLAEKLDPCISQLHSLKGFAFASIEKLSDSLWSYFEAFRLNPSDQKVFYDYALALSENNEFDLLKEMIEHYEFFHWEEETFKAIKQLYAEALLNTKGKSWALKELDALQEFFPEDMEIQENMKFIRANV